jgi:hypothetical protein
MKTRFIHAKILFLSNEREEYKWNEEKCIINQKEVCTGKYCKVSMHLHDTRQIYAVHYLYFYFLLLLSKRKLSLSSKLRESTIKINIYILIKKKSVTNHM